MEKNTKVKLKPMTKEEHNGEHKECVMCFVHNVIDGMIDEREVRSCERDEGLLDLINGLRDGFRGELNKLNDRLKKLEMN